MTRPFLALAGGFVLGCFLWAGVRGAVPCDAQAGQMQPRKLNRLDIIEQRLDKIEEKLGRIVFTEANE